MAKLQVTPIIGLPQFNGWSQVTTNSHKSLICSLAVFGQNAGNIGRDMVVAIEQAQPKSAAELHTFLQSLIEEVLQAGGQAALACLLAVDQKSILATYQGSILLKRQGKVGVILSSQDQLKVVEGTYTPDDNLVLATAQGSSYLGEIQQKINQGYDVDTIITSLVPSVHSALNSSLISMGFIKLNQWENEIGPEPDQLEDETPKTPVLPELEITLETLEEAENAPDNTQPLVTHVELELEPEISTRSPAVDLPVASKSKAPPISIMWTRSSKTSLLPPVSQLVKKISRAVGPRVTKFRQVLMTSFRQINWQQLQPQVMVKKITQRDVYVMHQSRQKLLKIMVPVGVIIVMVVIGWLFWRSQQAQQVQAAQVAVQPVVAEFAEAKTQVSTDPVNARSKMEAAVSQLEAIARDFANRPAGQRVVQEQLATLQAEYTEVSGREELSRLPIYLDLSQIAADWIATQITAEGSRVAVLDQGKNQIAVFDWVGTAPRTLSPLAAQPVSVTMAQDMVYVLGGGIWQANLADNGTEFSPAIEEGDSNREGELLGSFSSYLYVVNPSKRNIYRYTNNQNGFSDPIGWVKPGQQFSYDQLHSVSIDGDIWIGTTDGQIAKLSLGEVTDFQTKGLPEPFTGPLIVYTKESLQYVYVLEPASSRLVVLQKTGEFIRQIKSASLAATTGFVVDEASGKALAISGSLVFEVSL